MKLSKALIVMIGSLLVIFLACDRDLSLNPADTDKHGTSVTILEVNQPNSLSKEFITQKWIGSNGGTIFAGDTTSGYCYLKFPEGAIGASGGINGYYLSTDAVSAAYIQMIWESENLLQADFYPEGLQFNKPVYIRLSYKDADLTGIDESELALYYFNPETEAWELISKHVNTERDFVEGYINHFSRYAIGVE